MRVIKKTFGDNVITLLTANGAANFPDLPFTVAQITTANNNLASTYATYKQQGVNAKGAFTEAEEIWENIFSRTADYIDMVADGAVGTINLSGFHVTKTETDPAELLDAPNNEVEISNNERGCVSAVAKGLKGTKGYLFTMATSGIALEINGNQITVRAGDEFATFIISTQREVQFKSLPQASTAQA